MGKRTLSPYKSKKQLNQLNQFNKTQLTNTKNSSNSFNTKQKFIYIRTFENKEDTIIIASNFSRSTTLSDAVKSLDLPDIIDEETIFCTQGDFNTFVQVDSNISLNQLKSGTCFIPCYRFKLFKDNLIFVPKSFKGKDLCDLLENEHNIEPHLLINLRINSELVEKNKELYLQDLANDSRLSFLETDEELLETLETTDATETNVSQDNQETVTEFLFISPQGSKHHIKINSSAKNSDLCNHSELKGFLISYLQQNKIRLFQTKDFKLCHLNEKGGISSILSNEFVYSIDQPRIIFWRYEHCVPTFIQNLHHYMNYSDSLSLQFICETLFLSPLPEEHVFQPIFSLFNCNDIQINEEQLSALIRHLVTKAKTLMSQHEFSQLCKKLENFKTLSYVPNLPNCFWE